MCSVSSNLNQLDPIYPPSSQGYGFSSSHVRIWELDYKKAEGWRINAFELWCWRRLLRVPWTARRSNQSILKEISPEYSLEELMLKLRLRYFGHLIRRADSFEKTDAGKDWRQEEKGTTEDEMVGWTWVWASSRSWWCTGKPGMLQSMGSQRVRHDWATELNWTEGFYENAVKCYIILNIIKFPNLLSHDIMSHLTTQELSTTVICYCAWFGEWPTWAGPLLVLPGSFMRLLSSIWWLNWC